MLSLKMSEKSQRTYLKIALHWRKPFYSYGLKILDTNLTVISVADVSLIYENDKGEAKTLVGAS
jgi:hypothetical protein